MIFCLKSRARFKQQFTQVLHKLPANRTESKTQNVFMPSIMSLTWPLAPILRCVAATAALLESIAMGYQLPACTALCVLRSDADSRALRPIVSVVKSGLQQFLAPDLRGCRRL
jgi:hypothetical protein